MSISAGRHTCDIIRQSKDKIVCRVKPNYVSPNAGATDNTLGTAGFIFKHYNLTSAVIADNIADIRGPKSTVTLDKTENKFDIDLPDFYNVKKTMVHFRGYFKANVTGKHIFKMVSRPEVANIYLSNVADSASDSDLQKIMSADNHSYHTSHRNFDYKSKDTDGKFRSDSVTLTAGKLYLMEGFY